MELLNAINSKQGFKYQTDSKFTEGQSKQPIIIVTLKQLLQILNLHFKKICTCFKDIHMIQMTYNLPVKAGFNTIILKFAETYFNEKGERVFDVLTGVEIVLRDFVFMLKLEILQLMINILKLKSKRMNVIRKAIW